MAWQIEIDGKRDSRSFQDFQAAQECLNRELNNGQIKGKKIRLRRVAASAPPAFINSIWFAIIIYRMSLGTAFGIVKSIYDSMAYAIKTGNLILLAADFFFPPIGVIHGIGLWFDLWPK